MGKVVIVGVGPGNIKYVHQMAIEKIENADLLVGAERNLDTFRHLNKKEFVYKANLKKMVSFIDKEKDNMNITVVVSGDVGFYSLLDYIKKNIGEENIESIPGISSYQYMFAKVNKTYKEYGLYSIHGKDLDIESLLEDNKGIFLLTDNVNTPQAIAKKLMEKNICNLTLTVGENLSYENERITCGNLDEISKLEKSTLAVMIIEKNKETIESNGQKIDEAKDKMNWTYKTSGIPDDYFIRGKVPMTKSEVRAVTISKLMIKEDSKLLEIGCGTGSVTIEMALLAKKGKVVGIDKVTDALELTRANAKKFGVNNIETILGDAPNNLPQKEVFDRIFVGGASKKISEIVKYAENHLVSGGRFVANTILLKSTMEILNELEGKYTDIDCTQVAITKTNSKISYMMNSLNPIFVISASKK